MMSPGLVAAQEQFAEERVGGSVVSLPTSVDHETAALRVLGPGGYVLNKRFAAGQTLDADLLLEADSQINALPEGRYSYELFLNERSGQRSRQVGALVMRGGLLRVVPPPVEADVLAEGSISGPTASGDHDNFASIRFTGASGDSTRLNLNNSNSVSVGTDSWRVYNNIPAGRLEFRESSSMVRLAILKGGKVGVGTTLPMAPLEIAPASGNAAFRLNFPGGDTWAISNTGSDVTFNLIGSGGQETTYRERNDASGKATFEVQGSVKATNVKFSSARALKTGFEAIDTKQILAKLGQLEISSWEYKKGSPGRHVGPVAEDFRELFGLGDGTSISVVDAQGVTLAALQGLYETVQERDRYVEELEARVARLEELLLEGGD